MSGLAQRTTKDVFRSLIDMALVLASIVVFCIVFMMFSDGDTPQEFPMLTMQALGLVLAFLGTRDPMSENFIVNLFQLIWIPMGAIAAVMGVIMGLPWLMALFVYMGTGNGGTSGFFGMLLSLPLYAAVPGLMSFLFLQKLRD